MTHRRPGKQVKVSLFWVAIKTERRPTWRDCGDVPYGECTGSEYALCAYEHRPPDGECGPLAMLCESRSRPPRRGLLGDVPYGNDTECLHPPCDGGHGRAPRARWPRNVSWL